MRKMMFILMMVLLLLGISLCSVQAEKDQTWVQTESKGAHICSCEPDGNSYPWKDYYQGIFDGGCSTWFLIWFDLSGFPKGVQVTSAKLSLFCVQFIGDDNGKKDLVYSRITEPWASDKVTFANHPQFTSEDDALAGWPFDMKWQVVDITQMVQRWAGGSAPNYGILAHSVNKNICYAVFSRSDATVKKFRPKLTITYRK